jgi:hypothetical protein
MNWWNDFQKIHLGGTILLLDNFRTEFLCEGRQLDEDNSAGWSKTNRYDTVWQQLEFQMNQVPPEWLYQSNVNDTLQVIVVVILMGEYWRFHQSIAGGHHVIIRVQQLPIRMYWIRILGWMVNELPSYSLVRPLSPDGQNSQEKAAEPKQLRPHFQWMSGDRIIVTNAQHAAFIYTYARWS